MILAKTRWGSGGPYGRIRQRQLVSVERAKIDRRRIASAGHTGVSQAAIPARGGDVYLDLDQRQQVFGRLVRYVGRLAHADGSLPLAR